MVSPRKSRSARKDPSEGHAAGRAPRISPAELVEFSSTRTTQTRNNTGFKNRARPPSQGFPRISAVSARQTIANRDIVAILEAQKAARRCRRLPRRLGDNGESPNMVTTL
jgi:hypothetical protein